MFVRLDDLIGKKISKVVIDDESNDYVTLWIENSDSAYVIYHSQDCCECVGLHSCDFDKIVGKEITGVDWETDHDTPIDGNEYESFTNTTVTIKCENDVATARFIGSSNGYYGESVDIRMDGRSI